MSDTTGKQVPPGMQAILAAGQAMAQGFFDALARQHVAMQDSSGVAAHKLPMPETEVMASLQKVFAEKHAELWSSMLARTPGAAGPAVVQPEPGDKRFAAPEWSESPVFDYMRQAYLLNAGFLRQMADAMPIAIADDLDINLELPPGQARALVPGQALVVQWSAHSVPELSSPDLAKPPSVAIDPLDHEFDIRINNTPAPAVGARDILDEFNALLGAPRRKG